MRELLARPEVARALLRERLKPAAAAPKPEPAEVADWLAQLDAPGFARREAAERRLRRHGPHVAADVRAALEKARSAEARKRLTRLAAELDRPAPINPADARALELLEALGPAQALDQLRALAAGDPASPLTRDAALTLARLSRPKSN